MVNLYTKCLFTYFTHGRTVRLFKRISVFHHFFHVVHVALRVVLGVLTHGTCLNFVVFLGVVFFAVVLASSVVTHLYIYTRKKIVGGCLNALIARVLPRVCPFLFFHSFFSSTPLFRFI